MSWHQPPRGAALHGNEQFTAGHHGTAYLSSTGAQANAQSGRWKGCCWCCVLNKCLKHIKPGSDVEHMQAREPLPSLDAALHKMLHGGDTPPEEDAGDAEDAGMFRC